MLGRRGQNDDRYVGGDRRETAGIEGDSMLTIVVAIDSIEINAIENVGKANASEAIETIDTTDQFK